MCCCQFFLRFNIKSIVSLFFLFVTLCSSIKPFPKLIASFSTIFDLSSNLAVYVNIFSIMRVQSFGQRPCSILHSFSVNRRKI